MSITRDEAAAQGLKRYSTGISCERGHLCDRYTSNAHCIECERERPARGYREQGTEKYDNARAEKQRLSRAATGANATQSRKRYAEGRTSPQLRSARTPSWYTDTERRALKDFCECKPDGMNIDHIVPFRPNNAPIAGIHALPNLQYLPPRKDRLKGNRIEGDLVEHVRAGRAIWACDLNPDGSVNWQPYVGDALAGTWSAIVKEFGAEEFSYPDLMARGVPIPMHGQERAIRWLTGNVDLVSGGYRFVRVEWTYGTPAWRMTTA